MICLNSRLFGSPIAAHSGGRRTGFRDDAERCFGLNFFDIYIHKTVATDFKEQYAIAKRQGDKISICVQAGLVAAGYLQAHDEENYRA